MNLNICIRLLQRLHEIDSRIPITYALVLLLVAQDEGCGITDIAKKARLTLPTCSKIIHSLAEQRQKGRPLKLLQVVQHNTLKRNKNVFLSQAGKNLFEVDEFGKRW